MTEQSPPETGWYPDPSGGGGLRWWTGSSWSDDTRPHPFSQPDVPAFSGYAEQSPEPAWSSGPFVAVPPEDATPYPDLFGDRGRTQPRRSRKGLWLGVGVLAVLVVGGIVGLILLFSSLGSRSSLDVAAVEHQIAVSLAERSDAVTSVVCPDSVEIAAGTAFQCVATDDSGDTTIEVHQDDDQGNVTWRVVGG